MVIAVGVVFAVLAYAKSGAKTKVATTAQSVFVYVFGAATAALLTVPMLFWGTQTLQCSP